MEMMELILRFPHCCLWHEPGTWTTFHSNQSQRRNFGFHVSNDGKSWIPELLVTVNLWIVTEPLTWDSNLCMTNEGSQTPPVCDTLPSVTQRSLSFLTTGWLKHFSTVLIFPSEEHSQIIVIIFKTLDTLFSPCSKYLKTFSLIKIISI